MHSVEDVKLILFLSSLFNTRIQFTLIIVTSIYWALTMAGKVTVLYIDEPFNTTVWDGDRARDGHLLTLEITETLRGQTDSPVVSYTWHGWARICNLIDCHLPTQRQGEMVSVISWWRWRRDWGSLVNNICLHWGKTSCAIKPLHQMIGIIPHLCSNMHSVILK